LERQVAVERPLRNATGRDGTAVPLAVDVARVSDADGNECMMWQVQDDDSYYWRCAGVGYTCRDIGIEGRRGIFFQDLFVGSMLLDENLTVTWLPETYIPNNNIDVINIINDIIDINDINIIDISDDSDDNFDP
jgi:hypothetical protein